MKTKKLHSTDSLVFHLKTPANLRLRAKSNKLQQTAASKDYLTTRNQSKESLCF
jgi:hypothetical protein